MVDYHVHSSFSDDCDEEMEASIQRAIACDIKAICFCDHVDYGVKQDVGTHHDDCVRYNVDYAAYSSRVIALQRRYAAEITIAKGLEFGVQRHTIASYQKLVQSYPLDFIILSCHQISNQEFWNDAFQKGKQAEQIIHLYYEEILACIRVFKDYSVIGHLDMIKRYVPLPYHYETAEILIDEILKQVIADGKGIEVNTSGYRYGLSATLPDRAILKRYYERGGHILTIGSDAHNKMDVGEHVWQTMQLLKEIGFQTYCTYDAMTPIFHCLP